MKATVLIGVAGVAFSSMISYHMIYVPRQEQVGLIQTKTAQTQADQQAQQDVAALLAQVERYRKRLASAPEPSWLAREAVSLCRKAGLEVTTINPGSPGELSDFTRLSVELNFRATYHGLGLLLDDIQHSEYLLRVERLSLASGSSEAGSQASVNLVLSTLSLPPVLKQQPVLPSSTHTSHDEPIVHQ